MWRFLCVGCQAHLQRTSYLRMGAQDCRRTSMRRLGQPSFLGKWTQSKPTRAMGPRLQKRTHHHWVFRGGYTCSCEYNHCYLMFHPSQEQRRTSRASQTRSYRSRREPQFLERCRSTRYHSARTLIMLRTQTLLSKLNRNISFVLHHHKCSFRLSYTFLS
jgi:hypothetical protein